MREHRWCELRRVVPLLLVLGVLGVVGGCSSVQGDVRAKSRAALAEVGSGGVHVGGLYRSVTLTGPQSARDQALRTVNALPEVRDVRWVTDDSLAGASSSAASAESAEATPSASPSLTEVDANFSAAVAAGTITLSGRVPNEETRVLILAAARSAYGEAAVAGELTVASGSAPTPRTATAINQLVGLMPALATDLQTGRVTLVGGDINLQGVSPASAEAEELKRALTSAGATFTVVTPAEQAAAAEARRAAEEAARLTTALKDAVAGNRIGFENNSAVLTDASQPVVQQIATAFQAAHAASPGLRLEIRGYSSSDGDDAANLALSQERADSVLTALVAAGAPGDALAATGFGEADPIADNATEEGRAQNRRVELTVVEG